MNTIIRKISVGKDYPNGSLHYQTGSKQMLNRNIYYITGIYLDKELFEKGKIAYNIYIKKDPKTSNEIVAEVLWKTVIDVPVVVENNIDFD